MFPFSVAVVLAAGAIHPASAALRTRFEASKHSVRSVAFQQAEYEADAGIAHPTRLGIIVHRKTGFVMSHFAAECFDRKSIQAHRMMDPNLKDLNEWLEENKDTKYVHLAREPVDLAVSNYLYNKFTSHEPGTLAPGSAKSALYRCHNHCDDCDEEALEELPPYVDGEPKQEYLQRVDNQTGLLLTLCETRPIVERMLGYRQWCEDNSHRCMQVYLNEIMTSSEAFTSTFKKIADFAGYAWTPELEECLSYQDVHSANFGQSEDSHAGHVSTHAVSADSREQIKADARELDGELMKQFYTKASEKLLSFPTL